MWMIEKTGTSYLHEDVMDKFINNQTHWCHDAISLIACLIDELDSNPSAPLPMHVLHSITDLRSHLTFVRIKLAGKMKTEQSIGDENRLNTLSKFSSLVLTVERKLKHLEYKARNIKESNGVTPTETLSVKKINSAKQTVWFMAGAFLIAFISWAFHQFFQ